MSGRAIRLALAGAVVIASMGGSSASACERGVARPSVTTVATCLHLYDRCWVNVGDCEADGGCTVNVGTCESGARCIVNAGRCAGGQVEIVRS